MKIAKSVRNLIEAFERLPGIGPKTAARLTFYLLHVPQEELDGLAQAVSDLTRKTVLCSTCFYVDEYDPCSVCTANIRDKTHILVVEQPLDVIAFEQVGSYSGLYHVLHGAISPVNNIGPEELRIGELLNRVNGDIKEVILATNNDLEGEATAMYLAKNLEQIRKNASLNYKISRLAKGLPVGGEVEYADEVTLKGALEGRMEI